MVVWVGWRGWVRGREWEESGQKAIGGPWFGRQQISSPICMWWMMHGDCECKTLRSQREATTFTPWRGSQRHGVKLPHGPDGWVRERLGLDSVTHQLGREKSTLSVLLHLQGSAACLYLPCWRWAAERLAPFKQEPGRPLGVLESE